ncbi:hypothetical protein PV05_11130 [Exophiala xenobiotica]|uniref:Mediator of RNA polymerase II transcription subunit 20 n=1 Tax=Exophiala xenobiotica TaxID=348802 RepID=A0A0D2BBB6_9EURO|nr:uncharacterized protein PV05_11130 [Exophiala xenobiotica]KIW49456.1 hypothetical protein PV05_11130 [Exophiala xenobiotica]
MASTALFFLPLPPNQPSPSSTLISHISRSLPAEPLPPFSLDHRLFVDTSSLLPTADISQRRSTSILTLSHSPQTTFIGTVLPKDKSQAQPTEQPVPLSLSLTAIPASTADTFTQLIGTKLQPQWAHRQSLVVENGTALALHNGEWTIRLGDLKAPPRANQPVSIRGMLLEISYNAESGPTNETNGATASASVSKEDETLVRGVVDALTEGTGISLANSRVFFGRTQREENGKVAPGTVDWELARLYMDMLRGSRS